MATRAELARERQIQDIYQGLRSKFDAQNPNLEDLARDISDRLGNNHAGRNVGIPKEGPNSQEDILRLLQMRTGTAKRDQDALLSSAAYNTPMGPLARMQSTLARDDWQGRTAQTGLGVGIVGGSALGLTAAGQGLVALMDYIQQGTEAQSEREKPLG